MAINDGGPAYPLPVNDEQCRARFDSGYGGMSLRDAFAIAALPTIYAESVRVMEVSGFPDENWHDEVAMDAYAMADAMLRARTQDASQQEQP